MNILEAARICNIPDNPARVAPPDEPRPVREPETEPRESDKDALCGSGWVAGWKHNEVLAENERLRAALNCVVARARAALRGAP